VVIAGPTGIGKTRITAIIAKKFHSEVISFDSRQVYKELKIGTAFPSLEELRNVPHHMLGNKSIHQYYNASMFEEEVIDLLDNLFEKHDFLFMTGGTGFYLDAVLKGIDVLPTVDPDIRFDLRKKYEDEGIESIRMMLKTADPDYYKKVDLHNPNRILKALEVSIMTGKPYSSFLYKPNKKRSFNAILIGLDTDRDELYKRINERVDHMVEQGLVQEAKNLYPFKDSNALKTVGYKELFDFFEGKISLEEAIDLIKRHTRQYARRQLTWFRRYEEIKWFRPEEIPKIERYVKSTIYSGDFS
jgi:tRNA dimethylallyltransferase